MNKENVKKETKAFNLKCNYKSNDTDVEKDSCPDRKTTHFYEFKEKKKIINLIEKLNVNKLKVLRESKKALTV
jgi:hypothetical protein